MSKLLKNFVGIDISKPYFDVVLLKAEQIESTLHEQFKQTLQGFCTMEKWLKKNNVQINEETLFCMEYTGIYNMALVNYLCEAKALLWVEMPLRIKKAGGFERGSNDKTASAKIAWYAFRYQDEMQLWNPTDECLDKIKHLIRQRDRIVDTIARLTVPVKELKEVGCIEQAKQLEKLQKAAIKSLGKTKQNIEALIVKLVSKEKQLSNKVSKVKSIKGIGEVTAVSFLVYTKGFTSFENAKELACYCGVVPFTKSSGTSVRFKPGVSPYANKKLKRLLHLCALSAIQFDKELKGYYERKVSEGKNKMSVINAIRNKLVHRIFAVLRDDRDYVENYKRRCA